MAARRESLAMCGRVTEIFFAPCCVSGWVRGCAVSAFCERTGVEGVLRLRVVAEWREE